MANICLWEKCYFQFFFLARANWPIHKILDFADPPFMILTHSAVWSDAQRIITSFEMLICSAKLNSPMKTHEKPKTFLKKTWTSFGKPWCYGIGIGLYLFACFTTSFTFSFTEQRNKEGNDMAQQQTSWAESLANLPLQTICARLSAKTPASLDLQIGTEIEESAWSGEKSWRRVAPVSFPLQTWPVQFGFAPFPWTELEVSKHIVFWFQGVQHTQLFYDRISVVFLRRLFYIQLFFARRSPKNLILQWPCQQHY